MNARRLSLAMTILAGVAIMGSSVGAQGRGGANRTPPVVGRGSALTTEQQAAVRALRERQHQEFAALREKHRAEIERTLPAEARERIAQRRQQLVREGRMFERRQQMQRMQGMRGRGGPGFGRGEPPFGRGGPGFGRGIGPQRGAAQRGAMQGGAMRGGAMQRGGPPGVMGGRGGRGRGMQPPPIGGEIL